MPSRDRTPSPVHELRHRTISFSEEITPLNSKKIELAHVKAELDKALQHLEYAYCIDRGHPKDSHRIVYAREDVEERKCAVREKKKEIETMEVEERKRREQARLEMKRKEYEAWIIEDDKREAEEERQREWILQNGWWWQRWAEYRGRGMCGAYSLCWVLKRLGSVGGGV